MDAEAGGPDTTAGQHRAERAAGQSTPETATGQPGHGAAPGGPPGLPAVEAVAAGLGPYARRAANALALLAEGPRALDELIRDCGLSRRTVEELLAAAGPDIAAGDGGYHLREEAAGQYRERFGAPGRGGPPADTPPPGVPEEAAREIARLIAEAPAAKARLDHVAATPATALRRAAWLGETYDPGRTRLLCVGDHDLTALSACLVNPGMTARVADVDEDLLAHIDRAASRLGLDITCHWADFRFSLPPELAGWADVAFTDPPYTPEGVALFAARALEGLRDREFGQVVVAYGAGERRPALAWKVQHALSGGLGLAFEAILPQFSAYAGAQAIGSRSDLYVCRPTSATWKTLEQRDRRGEARIYTRGPQALEAHGEPPSRQTQRAVLRLATGDGAFPLAGIVGEGWNATLSAAGPAPAGPGPASLGPATPRPAPHAHLATLLSKGLPAAWARHGGAVAVDLSADPGPWLVRALVAANAARVAALVPNSHPDLADARGQAALRDLLGAKYDLRFHRSFPDPGHAVVEAERSAADGAADRLRRAVLERAHGAFRNAWREGLIALAVGGGRQLAKNEARAIIEAAAPPAQGPSRLIDMPRHQLAELLPRLDASVSRLNAALTEP